MEFVKRYPLVNEKAIFIECILRNLKSRRQLFEKNDTFILAAQEVYLINKGTLFQMNLLKEHFLYNYLTAQDFVVKIDPEKKIKLMAVENGEMIIFSKKEVFDFLNQEKLLANFYLTLLEKSYSVTDYLSTASTFSSLDKVKYVLYSIIQHVDEEPTNGFLPLPSWVNKKTIAQISQCSVSIVSKTLKNLEKENLLRIEHEIWYKHTRL